MLREAFDWLTTPTDRLTRTSGQLAEFVAIPARRRRCYKGWAEHEERCCAMLRGRAGHADPNGTALILGAGHLHDIPLEDLSTRFGHVALVDLAFSRSTRRLARALKNVSCVRHDVTEALASLAAGDTRVPKPHGLVDDERITFVASVNLLSQLPALPGRMLERQGLDEATIETVQRAIVDHHLGWLARFRCPGLLICDRVYEVLDRSGQLIETIDPLHGAILPQPAAEWVWNIAPMGEVDRDHAVRHRVVAISQPAE